MDKRTLLFVFSLSLALFFVNLFFTNREQERNRVWQEQLAQQKTLQHEQLKESVISRTASLKDFQLVQVYSDEQKSEMLPALQVEGKILLFVNKPAPVKIWVDGESGSLNVRVLEATVEESLAVYHVEAKEPSPLRIAELVNPGQYDLQLISWKEGLATVTFAEYIDGKFSLPLDIPANDALAFLKTSQGYLPVGVYKKESGAFSPLQDEKSLATQIVEQHRVENEKHTDKQERFYVLENIYQQLVFSNIGGALAEINLPFESEKNEKSHVKIIEFDKKLAEQHPVDSHFPLKPYYTSLEGKEMMSTETAGYYPLIRRTLLANKSRPVLPKDYALAVISDFPEVAELVYQVKEFTSRKIVFEATQKHRRITKTFTLPEQPELTPYCFEVSIKIDGDSRGLWVTSGVPEVEWISNAWTPEVKYRITRKQKTEVEKFSLNKESANAGSISPDWLCNSNGFFGIIIDAQSDNGSGFKIQYISGEEVPSRLTEVDQQIDRFKAKDLDGYNTALPLPSKGGESVFRVYAGPFAEDPLTTADSNLSKVSPNGNPDYILTQTFHGWFSFISQPFARFLFIVMKFFHMITDSWAFSIILLTVVLRLLLYPLNAWSMKSMRRLQKVAPEVQAIQSKHKKDPQKAQIEIMNLYRERGVNPLGGCFPILIQMPFLIGMFDLLKSTFEIRGASFIPGWIDNLTSPDVVFSWNTYIPLIGSELHLLPILLGAVMFLQSVLFNPIPKGTVMSDQQRQQRAMGTMMTVLFTFLFYHFPSGLNIYWLSSLLLGMLQQWITNRQIDNEPGVVEVITPKK